MSDSTGAVSSPARGDGGDGDGGSGGSGGTPDRARRGPERPGRIRNIGTFYKQVIAELRKVIWPTRKELITYTTVVVFFCLVMVAVIAVYDLIFGKAVLAIFGE